MKLDKYEKVWLIMIALLLSPIIFSVVFGIWGGGLGAFIMIGGFIIAVLYLIFIKDSNYD